MSAPVLKAVTGWVGRPRRRPGSQPAQRAGTVHTQVALVLRWLRHRLDLRTLAGEAGLSIATAYRYLHEALGRSSAADRHNHKRPSFTLSDTTFHFVDGDPATVLEQAREAARGKDVRLGGGATVIRQFLDADLVETMHMAVSPVKLGSGVRLWESPE